MKQYAAGNVEAGKLLFEGTGASTFKNTIRNLNELTAIQSNVGKTLVKESQSDMDSVGIISFLQIALAIIVGLVILVLIQNSNIINLPKTHPHGSTFLIKTKNL